MQTPLFKGYVLDSPIEASKVTFGSKYPENAPEPQFKNDKDSAEDSGKDKHKLPARKRSHKN